MRGSVRGSRAGGLSRDSAVRWLRRLSRDRVVGGLTSSQRCGRVLEIRTIDR